MTFASTFLPMPAQTLALSRYVVACRAVAAARAVDDVMVIVAQADALRVYARQAKLVGKAQGEFRRRLKSNPREAPAPPTLAEAGIDKTLAHRARTYAAVPQEKFETLLRTSGKARTAASYSIPTSRRRPAGAGASPR